MTKRAVIVGATSAVGEALAASYARDGWAVMLVGRDRAALAAVAADLRLRHGGEVGEILFDAAHVATAEAAARACAAWGPPDLIAYVAGSNSEAGAPEDSAEVARVHAVNFLSAAAFVAPLLPALEHRRNGSVLFVSSVAGDRGRKGNFVYGSAKAALNAYAQGLRGRLHAAKVSVTTVKLGYVDSRMSFGLSPPALTVSPEYAARRIRVAVDRRRDVVYVPGLWRLVMALIQAVPEGIFKRLALP